MIVGVRNLRVAVILIRDAITVIIRIRHIRVTVTIGVQLEVRLHVIRGLIRVRHRNRNIELLNGVLVQLGLIRERHRDLTGVLINLDLIALRSLEVTRNRKLRTLRSLGLLTVLASEGRRRLRLLTRNNKLALIGRFVEVSVLLGQVNNERVSRQVVAAVGDNSPVVAAVGRISRDFEGGALTQISLRRARNLTFLQDVARTITPFQDPARDRQVTLQFDLGDIARLRRVGHIVKVGDVQLHRVVRHGSEVHVVHAVELSVRQTCVVRTRHRSRCPLVVKRRVLEHRLGVSTRVRRDLVARRILNPHVHIVLRIRTILRVLILRETQRVITVLIRLSRYGASHILRVLSQHLLRQGHTLFFIRSLDRTVRLLTLRGQPRCIHRVPLRLGIRRRRRTGNNLTLITGLQPHVARHCSLRRAVIMRARPTGGIRSRDRAAIVDNPLILRRQHVLIRRNLKIPRSSALHVAVRKISTREFTQTRARALVIRARNHARSRTQRHQLIAVVRLRRFRPHTVLLGPQRLEFVDLAFSIRPLRHRKRIQATSTGTSDTRQLVRYSRINRRNGTILVHPLEIHLLPIGDGLISGIRGCQLATTSRVHNHRATRHNVCGHRLSSREQVGVVDLARRNRVNIVDIHPGIISPTRNQLRLSSTRSITSSDIHVA